MKIVFKFISKISFFMIFLVFVLSLVFYVLTLTTDYRHIERFNNIIKGSMDEFIEHDKKYRIILMKQKNLSNKEINEELKKLEKHYKIEREKVLKYCSFYVEDESNSEFDIHSKHCTLYSTKEKNRFLLDSSFHTSIHYRFDKKSREFFNEVLYMNKRRDRYSEDEKGIWYPIKFKGFLHETLYFGADEIHFKGFGEGTSWDKSYGYPTKKFDRQKHVEYQ